MNTNCRAICNLCNCSLGKYGYHSISIIVQRISTIHIYPLDFFVRAKQQQQQQQQQQQEQEQEQEQQQQQQQQQQQTQC